MKTLADLKRDAKTNTLEAKLIFRFGNEEKDLPLKIQGFRPIIGLNTVDIFFRNANGERSALELPKASLIEYTEDRLTIFIGGFRDLNIKEQEAMQEWEQITKTKDFQERSYYDALTDGTSTFYQEKSFFINKNMEYLMGCSKIKGLKYDFNRKQIQDDSIKGEKILEYVIRRRTI